MPGPLAATLSTSIRVGLRGAAITPAFSPGNIQTPTGVAGIPLAIGSNGLLEYGYVYQYATINPCPDVDDIQVRVTGDYVSVGATLSDSGVAGLIVLDRVTRAPLYADLSLGVKIQHSFSFDRPAGRYRAVVLGGSAPIEDLTFSQNPLACTPEVIDLSVVVFDDILTLHAELTGPSGCIVYVVNQLTAKLAAFQYQATASTLHDFTFNLPNASYRAYVFAVGNPVQDA